MKLFLLIFLLFIVSCTQNKILNKKEIITFEMPYEPMIRNSGVVKINADSNLFYFFDSKTYKQIDVFDFSQNHLLTVSLKNILSQERGIEDIAIYSLDSIFVLSENTNNIYRLNRNGKITGFTHIPSIINDSIKLELHSSLYGSFLIKSNEFIFNCIYYPMYEKDNPENLATFYKTNKSMPYFLVVKSPFSMVPDTSYHCRGFYNRFLKNDEINVEGALYNKCGKSVSITSWYTDSIYMLNNNYEIDKAYYVHSQYTKIGCNPLTIQNLTQDSLNFILQTQGAIDRIFYDKYRNVYYVVVIHETTSIVNKGAQRKWSILIYDDEFKLIHEQKMPEKLYWPGGIFIREKGLFIQLADSKNKFQIFSIEKI